MDALAGLLAHYGGWGFAGAFLVASVAMVMRGDLVTKTMLTEIRANDRDTIETLKEANAVAISTLPEILKSVQGTEYAMREIQRAGKVASRD